LFERKIQQKISIFKKSILKTYIFVEKNDTFVIILLVFFIKFAITIYRKEIFFVKLRYHERVIEKYSI